MLREYRNNIQKYLHTSVNIVIVIAVLALTGVLVKKYLLPVSDSSVSVETNLVRGERILLPETTWQINTKTLLLFLHSDCVYRKNSVEFYQSLIKETSNREDIKLLAIFSGDDKNRETFMKNSNLSAMESRQADFVPLKVRRTPTLVLVDENGIVLEVWNGKLSPMKEKALLTVLGVQGLEKTEERQINEAEVNRLVNKQSLVIIDLRERENYDKEHFPNAVNIPADELPVRAINELSPSDTIVIYGDYDEDKKTEMAETILSNQGYKDVLILQRNSKLNTGS